MGYLVHLELKDALCRHRSTISWITLYLKVEVLLESALFSPLHAFHSSTKGKQKHYAAKQPTKNRNPIHKDTEKIK
jgi:hypothetical protein